MIPRKLYDAFNKVLVERQLPFRSPDHYLVEHLKEALQQHEEWKKRMAFTAGRKKKSEGENDFSSAGKRRS